MAAGRLGAATEAKTPVSEPTEIHRRTIEIEIRPEGGGAEVLAALEDLRRIDMGKFFGAAHPPGVVHHMGLRATLDEGDTIRTAGAWMKTIPFEPLPRTDGETCRAILPHYDELVGETFDEGYAVRIMQRFGGEFGCFHLASLAQCLPFARRAAAGRGLRREIVVSSLAAQDEPGLRLASHLKDERDGVTTALDLVLDFELPEFGIRSARSSGASAMLARRLEELAVAKGFTNAALERIGGDPGLAALVVALTPVTAQASGALAAFHKIDWNTRARPGSGPIGSCHMWRAGGPILALQAKIARGEGEPR